MKIKSKKNYWILANISIYALLKKPEHRYLKDPIPWNNQDIVYCSEINQTILDFFINVLVCFPLHQYRRREQVMW